MFRGVGERAATKTVSWLPRRSPVNLVSSWLPFHEGMTDTTRGQNIPASRVDLALFESTFPMVQPSIKARGNTTAYGMAVKTRNHRLDTEQERQECELGRETREF